MGASAPDFFYIYILCASIKRWIARAVYTVCHRVRGTMARRAHHKITTGHITCAV